MSRPITESLWQQVTEEITPDSSILTRLCLDHGSPGLAVNAPGASAAPSAISIPPLKRSTDMIPNAAYQSL
jgi:hypothetical protein